MGRKINIVLLAVALLGAFAVIGCGPKYPDCATDDHCKERGEFCVNKTCRPCADDADCAAKTNNPCKVCGVGFQCTQARGCCTSDLDCPGGRCWDLAGKNYGECGDQCRAGHPGDCPADQICRGGNCVPADSCTDDSHCPPGKRCVDGTCVESCNAEPAYFDFNESTLRRDARAVLQNNMECINKRAQNLSIEGHCDERGSDEYNLSLGEKRARKVQRYMKKLGVSVEMNTISYGEERPICTESNEDCWWRNRRGEIVFQ